jgi:hypothetical protein
MIGLGLRLGITATPSKGVPFDAWRYVDLRPVRKEEGGYWKKGAA